MTYYISISTSLYIFDIKKITVTMFITLLPMPEFNFSSKGTFWKP